MKRYKTVARKPKMKDVKKTSSKVVAKEIEVEKKCKAVKKSSVKVVEKDVNVEKCKDVKVEQVKVEIVYKQPEIEDVGQFQALKSRMSHSCVYRVVSSLSNVQKKDVREIGFGSLLDLKATHLPLQLAYWLVVHFDAGNCSLSLPNEQPLVITEEDVHDVLGLPVGGEVLQFDADEDSTMLNSWKKQFETNGGGPMFKRNFVVLCYSTLMFGSQNHYIGHWILRFLSSVGDINKCNWCKFVLDCLVEAKKYWQEKPSRFSMLIGLR